MAYYPLGSRIAYAMPDIIGKRSADIRKTKRRGFDLVSEEDMLSGAYLDYEISREIRTYLLSSASGIDSLRILIEALVDKVLRIAISNGQEDHSGQKKIAVDARIICRQIPANYSRMQGLGDSRGSILGETFLTNGNDGERVPNLQIIIIMSGGQLTRLDRNPQIRQWLIRALDQSIPLNLDYQALIAVRKEDHDFRLAEPGGSVRLGFTTALGKVPEKQTSSRPAINRLAQGKNLMSAGGESN